MLDELVGQFLKSSDGSELLKDLQTHGLSPAVATEAVTATAQGAMQQVTGGGAGGGLDLASLAGGLLGGGQGGGGLGSLLGGLAGGAGAGGLCSLLGGLTGGGGAQAGANPLSALVGPVAQFVAEKTGLAPVLAQTVVAAVLPKLMAMVSGATGATAAPQAPAQDGGQAPSLGNAADILGSLFK